MVDTKATDSKKGEVNPENIIPISMEKLTPEQKAEFELMKDNLQNQFLQSFKQTRSGVIQKYKLMMSPNTDPEPSTSKGDKPKTDGPKDDKPEEETPLEFENFQGQIDYAVHQALINQSGVLVNTLTNIIKSVVDGTIAEQQVRGPTFLPNDVMRDQFVLKPKDTGNLYRHPYHEYFERVPLPNRYKVPDFSKFSGQDNVSTYEHVSRFLAQCVLM
uniref:Retrotransposon protein, putative, unclassified n=1 Tax=Oryza sativa subsp. japonica TaxID=39947 RepID=Q53K75_ORYSJ|nr:hypothetical protein [Oryza sativa Japonica Group]ABF97753.1 retrotransposon protein, putative, unclassified [Oryza sativa Japonica Group]